MKALIRILLMLVVVISSISLYWILARHTDLFFDEILQKGKWGNVSPASTFISGLISIIILIISLKYYTPVFQTIKPTKSIKVGFFCSIFFILIATMFWSDSWTDAPSAVLDSRELGDRIWKLGHPLTFLIIDLPIYLRRKIDGLQGYWNDLWVYPSVLLLFVTQVSIYIHGLRIIINLKKIKTTYNRVNGSAHN